MSKIDNEAWGSLAAHSWLLGSLYVGACVGKADPVGEATKMIAEMKAVALGNNPPGTVTERLITRAMGEEFDRILAHMLATLAAFDRNTGHA